MNNTSSSNTDMHRFIRFCLRIAVAMAMPLIATVGFAATLEDFHNPSEDLGSTFFRSSWFGTYCLPNGTIPHDQDNMWIYHFEHGWISVKESLSGSGWFIYDLTMDAVWFTSTDSANFEYPDLWHFGWAAAADYTPGSAPYRRFWNHSVSEYRYVETNLANVIYGPAGPVPFWWVEYGMIDLSLPADNKAVLNSGQLKHAANRARAYLDGRFGLTESEWNTAYDFGSGQVNPFTQNYMKPAYSTGNYDPVTQGQLKYIARGFYRILSELEIERTGPQDKIEYNIHKGLLHKGYPPHLINQASIYPWDGTGLSPDNLALATIGQFKMLFSFDPEYVLLYGEGYLDQLISQTDTDGDLFNVWVEIMAGSDSEEFDSYSNAASWPQHGSLSAAMDQEPYTPGLVLITPEGKAYAVKTPDLSISKLNFQH